MIMLTTALPVIGSVQSLEDLRAAVLARCGPSATMTRRTPDDEIHRAAGALDHLARHHPVGEVAVLARPRGRRGSTRSMWPPRIIANESALEKKLEPGIVVMVCLPALMRSGSTSSSVGNGPMPSRPFSDCSTTSMPRRNVVGDQRRDADAEVDVVAVAQLLGGAARHQFAHRRVLLATRCAGDGAELDALLVASRPGRSDRRRCPACGSSSGSSSPTSTRCSTSATVTSPQVAIIGLKLRAVLR